eukprot:CAMPEP_0170541980 /NCGR_PEP_ID=MMETSP0211-20121228/1555_1 /TAXON_ID=311385 /ORGANISM="Pseudokeronopsis sp., Strain OXSARD2" /LENGTH=200 /DNA_ID=CAMNT_0010844903 /DNA_START=129 /DNA_END=732 /DNA_ORIENTATION=-
MTKFQEKLQELTEMTQEEFNQAVYWIIYLLDIGRFLYTSDVCLANLDEPLDPGLIVEMMFATHMGKHIIGYKTDMRTPYGISADIQGGMHSFCYFPCHDYFLYSNEPIRSKEEGKKVYDYLCAEIEKAVIPKKGTFKSETTPYAQQVVNLANKLFEGVIDYNSDEGMLKIINNYSKIKDDLVAFGPTAKRLSGYGPALSS